MAPALTTANDRLARLDPRALELDSALTEAVVAEAVRLFVRPGRPLAAPAVDGVTAPRVAGALRVFAPAVDGVSAVYVASVNEQVDWAAIAAAWAAMGVGL
jgi:hypothetical protein